MKRRTKDPGFGAAAVKFTLNILEKRSDDDADRSWPRHVFGGRVRTSTLVLDRAFLAVWWVYDTYKPGNRPTTGPPATQVVPPGFVPDPNYTWVPRTRVQQPPADTSRPHPHDDDPADDHRAAARDHDHTAPAVRPAARCRASPPFCTAQHEPATPLRTAAGAGPGAHAGATAPS